jgi:glycosidase
MNRAFDDLEEDMDAARVAASLLLTGPGVPFLYYGEEVAMSGSKPDEDIRKPFPWSGKENGGFTVGEPWRALPDGYEERNVATMGEEASSLLNHYRRLIHLRNAHEALRVGEYLVVDSSSSAIFPFVRQSENQTLLIVQNMSGESIEEYDLSLDEGATVQDGAAVELLGGATTDAPEVDDSGGFNDYSPLDVLEPYETYVIQLRP